jgi:UDP-glucose 4-epimerase
MKYIITGGLGFIGSHLVERLKGKNIVSIDNNYSTTNNGDYVKADVRDDKIEKYFQEGDIVIHLAAVSSLPECQENPQLAYDVNVNGTLNVLEICRKKNIKKILFASTSAVYENNKKFPCSESDDTNPTLVYSMSKKHCEEICLSYVKNYGMDITILRFFNTYGGNQNYDRTSPPLTIYILNELYHNRVPVLHSDGCQKRDYVYIEDLLDLIIRVIETHSKGEIFNACSGNLVSVNEIYEIIKNKIGKDIFPKYNTPVKFWNRYPSFTKGKNPLKREIIEEEVTKFTFGCNKKSKEFFDWKPRHTIQMGLEKTTERFLLNIKK